MDNKIYAGINRQHTIYVIAVAVAISILGILSYYCLVPTSAGFYLLCAIFLIPFCVPFAKIKYSYWNVPVSLAFGLWGNSMPLFWGIKDSKIFLSSFNTIVEGSVEAVHLKWDRPGYLIEIRFTIDNEIIPVKPFRSMKSYKALKAADIEITEDGS